MTPMMEQYLSIKERHQDAILFFRLGDFYEMFFDDAIVAAKELEIALTKRDMGQQEKAPMCGVPHHSSAGYIEQLVSKGYKVAICEQMEDPKDAKGIVKREVVQVITPGILLPERSRDENNHLMSLQLTRTGFSVAVVDITTGEFSATAYQDEEEDVYPLLLDEIAKWQPKELLVSDTLYANASFVNEMQERYGAMIGVYDAYSFSEKEQADFIREKMPAMQKGHPLLDERLAVQATAALLRYVYQYSQEELRHIRSIDWYETNAWMKLDQNTRAHLEIRRNQRTLDTKHTLFSVLHHTRTAMGTRRLHRFLERPLVSVTAIRKRQEPVRVLTEQANIRLRIGDLLDGVHDLDRLIGKLSYQKANARDLLSLARSLSHVKELKAYLETAEDPALQVYGKELDPVGEVIEEIQAAIEEDPPVSITEGGLIRVGYHAGLDAIRDTSIRGQEALVLYEQEMREETNIRNLKIVYNKLKGYYLDVTKSHLDKVPDTWIRRQTLTNSERYITDRLLHIQSMIQDSNEETRLMEYNLFQSIREHILDRVERIQKTSQQVSQLDVLYAFAVAAARFGYVQPAFRKDGRIRIQEGRHPVVEQTMEEGSFVYNDTELGADNNRLQIITGPNMAGKSTYMRQVALIVLMAQIGSFVPARSASIGIVDQIFTRIGATDHLSAGDSTFMVEMKEMSYILSHATKNSLLILDEIGRGTSTFDGMSIAWAIIEYIAEHLQAKTLFATHYHELTALAEQDESIRNMTIAIREEETHIVFLRKVMPGQTDRSYGIEVAKMAKFPAEIIARAQAVLRELEEFRTDRTVSRVSKEPVDVQIDLREIERAQFLASVAHVEIERTTPVEALLLLEQLRDKARELGENA